MYIGYTFHGQHILHVRDSDAGKTVTCDTCSVPEFIVKTAIFAAENNVRELTVDGVTLKRTYTK